MKPIHLMICKTCRFTRLDPRSGESEDLDFSKLFSEMYLAAIHVFQLYPQVEAKCLPQNTGLLESVAFRAQIKKVLAQC